MLTVQPQRQALTAELAGRTQAFMVAQIRPQVGGIVQQRLFVEGAEVKALRQQLKTGRQELNATQPDCEDADQLDKVLQHCLAIAGHDHLICLISDFAGADEW